MIASTKSHAIGQPRFAVLGEIEISRDGKDVHVEGGRARALLAFMLARANGVVSADELIDAVWHGRRLRDPHNVLQACVSRLRRVLGEDVLETTPGGYRLAIPPEHIDAYVFEGLVAVGAAALDADDAPSAVDAFARALELWRGEPYPDAVDTDSLATEARRLGELRMAAIEGRVDALLRLGEGAELVAELEGLVRAHPFQERLRSQQAIALYRAGRQADALAACRAARRLLREELGLDVSRELHDVEVAILRHDPELDRRSVTAPPTPVTPLFGREHELRDALRLFRRQDVRMLTLTGPGGIGKTRLALAMAAKLGGAVFVDLANVVDCRLVTSAIATSLGLRQWGGQSVEDAVEQHLRHEETLLFLDSFERVIEEAPLLPRLLAAAPRLKLLVTSRSVLRVTGEHDFPIGPLGHEDAVRLFRTHAAAGDPAYTESPAEEQVVREICTRLDGSPLAIELAAARTSLLSLDALRQHLVGGFDVLFAGRRDAPARHQTLRATMDWSWALLGEDERLAFERVSVFVGGFTLEAAEAVLDVPALPWIGSLVDKSLVQRAGDDRFRLLDTVREYAAERLAARGDEGATRLRHAKYFAGFVEGADGALLGPGEQDALRRLELDHTNIRAAFAFAMAEGQSELAVRIAVASRRFWHYHGHLVEGLAALNAALDLVAATDDTARGKLFNGAGILAAQQGDYETARSAFDRSADLGRQMGSRRMLGNALGNLARIAMIENDFRRAQELLEQALRDDPNDDYVATLVLESLSAVALAGNDLNRALLLAQECCSLARKGGSPLMIGNAALALGSVLLERAELGEAAAVLEESLRLKVEIAERPGLADCLEVIGGFSATGGDGETAAALFGAAGSVRASVGAARSPDMDTAYGRYVARATRGAGEAAFDRAFAAGAALAMPEAVTLAVNAVSAGERATAPTS